VAALDTVTAMAMMPLFDGTGWDPSVCAAAGVDPAMLPPLSPGAAAIGDVDGVPVNGGTVDVFAEQLVADARAPGDVLVLCGTTLIPWVLTTGWPEVDGLWTVPSTVPGLTAVGGASNAGGLFVDAVRGLLGGAQTVDDAELDALDPAALPVWLPYLRGERTPLHDPARRAELRGLALGHGPAAVLRAAYEASAFVVRRHVELARVSPVRVVAVGGGTRSVPWMQALADATGLPVDVSAVPDGAALGAAYLARVTAGLEADTSGSARWARTGRRVEPRPAWADACADRYRDFVAWSTA
jgi:xylulokinase